MGCYLLFRFLINETNPSPTSRIPFGTFGVFFFLLDDDVTASPYCYCDGDEEQRAGEIIEITSSPEPEGGRRHNANPGGGALRRSGDPP